MYKIYALKLKNCEDYRYIGKTKTKLSTRLSKHKTNARLSKTNNYRSNWINKHKDEIEIVLLEDDIETELESGEREIYYIAKYKKIYNLTNSSDGGTGGCTGYKHTEEAKAKIGKAHKGKVVSEATKELLRNKIVTKETRLKLSKIAKEYFKTNPNPMQGKKRPDTVERNKSITGWKHSTESKEKMSRSRIGVNNGNYKHGKKTKDYLTQKPKRVRKLTDNQVKEIRELAKVQSMTQKQIGDIYGISGGFVGQVIRRVKYPNIT